MGFRNGRPGFAGFGSCTDKATTSWNRLGSIGLRGGTLRRVERVDRLQIADDILAKERRMADLLDSIKGRLARKP